jgi:hypothetical protein
LQKILIEVLIIFSPGCFIRKSWRTWPRANAGADLGPWQPGPWPGARRRCSDLLMQCNNTVRDNVDIVAEGGPGRSEFLVLPRTSGHKPVQHNQPDPLRRKSCRFVRDHVDGGDRLSTLDSLLDLLSGFILWFRGHAMKKPNKYSYPIGKRRMQPVVFAETEIPKILSPQRTSSKG